MHKRIKMVCVHTVYKYMADSITPLFSPAFPSPQVITSSDQATPYSIVSGSVTLVMLPGCKQLLYLSNYYIFSKMSL